MGSFERSPKMAPNDPKSAIFPDDVSSYPGIYQFSNQSKKMGLKKYYLEMV